MIREIKSVEEYENLLKHMDWYYEYSDDHRYWRKGADDMKCINHYAAQFDPNKTLYNKYSPK